MLKFDNAGVRAAAGVLAKMSAEVNPVTAAYLINAITGESFRRYFNHSEMTIEEMHAIIRDQIKLLWRGFARD